MESTASLLKTRRESLNTSLEKISRDTHISIHHLRSLESGRYTDLPGGMYSRAILRAYCEELGLDKNEILRIYDAEVGTGQEKPEAPPVPLPSRIRIQTATAWSLIFIFAICIFLNREWFITALSPYFSSDYERAADRLQPEYPPVSTKIVNADTTINAAIATRVMDGTADVAFEASRRVNDKSDGALSERSVQTALANSHPLRLEIVGKEECWLSVTSDETIVVEKLLSPGDVAFFTATQTIYVIVGNAGGVTLRINDHAARTLGQSGEVVRLTIDKDTLQNLLDSSAG
jgi:cytoskeletal protein RodZ